MTRFASPNNTPCALGRHEVGELLENIRVFLGEDGGTWSSALTSHTLERQGPRKALILFLLSPAPLETPDMPGFLCDVFLTHSLLHLRRKVLGANIIAVAGVQ